MLKAENDILLWVKDIQNPVNSGKLRNGGNAMHFNGRAQCLIVRNNKILMVKHRINEDEWFSLPGGGIEIGENPETAAIRELKEECLVQGNIIKKVSEFADPFDSNKTFYTFHIDIQNQTPRLGSDPEFLENPILIEVCWLALNEISEIDRAYLWSSGLFAIKEFAEELHTWGREISYPRKR